MIRKAQEVAVAHIEKNRGGKGVTEAHTLLKDDEFYGKGRMFNHIILTPGSSVGYHKHEGDFEAYYILSGEGTYNDNGTECPVSAGDVTICKEGESHSLENTGSENLEFMALILYTN